MKLKFFILISLFAIQSYAQTFNGSGGSIPGNNTYVNFNIAVSGLPTSINKTTFGIESVTINITHPNTSDLRIRLDAPDGTSIVLSSYNGGTGNNYTSTTLCDTATFSVNNSQAPFTGTFLPDEYLSTLNNGQNPNGNWALRVRDLTAANLGNVVSWSIKFSSSPAGSFPFSSSNLPIVILQTAQAIPNGIRIPGTMGIIDNGPGIRNYLTDPWNNYNGNISIEERGQSSAGFPQPQYNVETQDAFGNNLNTSILGMPQENDWVLYAPYNDKTIMRNVLTYKLGRDFGKWAPRTRFCEVVLNNQYQGIYVMMEKIKRDSNRVNISKLEPFEITAPDVSGGYIISVDKGTTQWSSPYAPLNSTSGQTINFQYVYPDPSDIAFQQEFYIQQYVDSFETALYGANFQDPNTGYRKYASVKSFVDFFIVNELSKNVDGYRLSTYLHKDKIDDGGQLKAGPLWDFNLAWDNADYCDGWITSGWAYDFNSVCSGDYWQVPFWWNKMLQDSAFQNRLYCRWTELRNTYLDTVNLFAQIDSMASDVYEAKSRHFSKYQILGVYTWPNPSPLPDDFPEEIRVMKNWIYQRMLWLDNNILPAGTCASTTGIVANTKPEIHFQLYPNPAVDELTLSIYDSFFENYKYEISDIKGNKIAKGDVRSRVQNFDLRNFDSGIYLFQITDSFGRNIAARKVIVNR